MMFRLPSPSAYIFNKGLIFPRRKARTKKGKDLYYIFDLLVYRDDFRDKIVSDLGLEGTLQASGSKHLQKT